MNNVAVYTLTSELHNAEAINAETAAFLSVIPFGYDFRGSDFSDYGTHALNLVYVRTGGTEGLFLRLLQSGAFAVRSPLPSSPPFYLLTSGKNNSLAASMEILSYLRQQGMRGEIIHGGREYMSERIGVLLQANEAKHLLRGQRLGIIGQPSDWLIASHADKERVKRLLGIELMDIPMQELFDELAVTPVPEKQEKGMAALPVAYQIYEALKALAGRHRLQGFTLRCFDLLSSVHNTGCLSLAKLNAEGFVAGCEGDVPALLSMAVVKSLTGVSGFQANPSRIDPMTGRVLFAHCTIPLNMVEHYELDTHFESGIGVGIRGYMAEGPVTIFKLSGDLTRCFIEEGELMAHQPEPNLCRTQLVVRLSNPQAASNFLTAPIGNHHIIVPGHHKAVLQEVVNSWQGTELL